MAAACDVPMSILDGLPPHVWHGPTASEDWHRDVTVAGDREGATDYFVALGEPWHVNVTGDRSYVVVPATMTFRVHGQPVTQPVRPSRWRFASSTRSGASWPGRGPRGHK